MISSSPITLLPATSLLCVFCPLSPSTFYLVASSTSARLRKMGLMVDWRIRSELHRSLPYPSPPNSPPTGPNIPNERHPLPPLLIFVFRQFQYRYHTGHKYFYQRYSSWTYLFHSPRYFFHWVAIWKWRIERYSHFVHDIWRWKWGEQQFTCSCA